MAISFVYGHINAQSKGGIEQYNYFNNAGVSAIMPIVHFEDKKGWHAEARYNYEALKTLSFHFGKSFSHDGLFPWSATPIVGFAVGDLKGVAAGTNLDVEFNNFFLSSQPEFVVAFDNANENFFYNWSELGYTIRKWIYAGFTMQQTVAGSGNQTEKGIIIGFNIKKFTIPVYFFNPMKPDKYFILGINWEWDKH